MSFFDKIYVQEMTKNKLTQDLHCYVRFNCLKIIDIKKVFSRDVSIRS